MIWVVVVVVVTTSDLIFGVFDLREAGSTKWHITGCGVPMHSMDASSTLHALKAN
jgi:hypothetical protein